MFNILHVTPHFLPAREFGGPVFSVASVCSGIAEDDRFRVSAITTDAASPNNSTRLDLDANPQRFDPGYDVYYARRDLMQSTSAEMLRLLPKSISQADLVHLSWTYSFPTIPTLALARLMSKPLIWSPHGSLQASEEWHDAPRKRLKKQYERVCRIAMPRDTVLHLTADSERDASLKRIPNARASVIANGVDIPRHPVARKKREDGKLRLLYLSRLHEKKGLEFLFRSLVDLPDATLDVFGTGLAGYVASLRTMVSECGLSERVNFHGHCDGERKTAAFNNADLFVLPTQGENFGIVVAEALAAGLPVITTKNAPWSGIEKHRCGRWVDLGVDQISNAVRELASADLKQMGARGRNWMRAEFAHEVVNKQMIQLYLDLLGAG